MRAALYDGHPGTIRLAVDYVEPKPAPGEVRVRVTLVGICNTDLEILRGYGSLQGVLGHEFVGVVDQAEDPDQVGRRVVGEISIYCGSCEMCRAGHTGHCLKRTTLGIRNHDGVLADYVCLPSRNLHVVPDQIPDEAAVFTEPLAAGCEILEQVQVRPSDRVVVLGDGKLGLLTAQVLALTGCDLTVVGRYEKKLDILASRGISVQLGDPLFAKKADLVVECSGRAEGFQMARKLVRPRGTLVLKSTYHGRIDADQVGADLSDLVVDEIQLVGSRCGPFPAALRLLAQGLVDVAPLVDATYPLDDVVEAFDHARRRGTLKVLVKP